MSIKYGVPQGSTLGPLLFIIYVNDLLLEFKKKNICSIEMYADDTVIYVSNVDPIICFRRAQVCLDLLTKWCYYNKLTINVKKTKHMIVPRHFDSLKTLNDRHVNISGLPLTNSGSYKYLGVVIDSGLTFDAMLDNTYNKANRKLYILKRIRPYITNSITLLIYKTCVLPLMEYADFLVESGAKTKVDKLERIQKRAIRCADLGKHRGSDYNDLMELYGIEPLWKRRKHHHLLVMYRHAQDTANLNCSRPGIILRSSTKIKFRNRKTALTKVQKSPYNRGVSLWDRLPADVQRATTKVKFKNMVRNM